MTYRYLLISREEEILTVTLNRPERLNALSVELLSELLHLAHELRDDPECRFVIFTGSGRAFSSGADLSSRGGPPPERLEDVAPTYRYRQLFGHEFMRTMENMEQITIAAVNGLALGAGLSLCMTCDFRIASETAFFGIPEVNVGIFFTWGCTPRLTSLIGPAWAKDLIMTGRRIDAREALSIGLVHRVVPPDEVLSASRSLAKEIGGKAPLAIRMTKKIVNAATAPNIGDIFICEPEMVERLYLSTDPWEGANAFLEKRKPDFKGK
jgi:enoyl-CoA hydratase/carnithine racemase